MDQPDWLPESLVLWAWAHLKGLDKERGAGTALTLAIHGLALLALLYVVTDSRRAGLPAPEVNVSLSPTASLAKAETTPQPQLVQPTQPVDVKAPDITITDTSSLRAMPVVTEANATPGQSEYLYRLWRFGALYMHLPRSALISGAQGVVYVHVVIDRAGMAALVEIDTSSGNPELDAAVIDFIKKAQPLPVFPDSLGMDYFSTVWRFGFGAAAVAGKMDALTRH